jgi:UTP--glucose-1-phosphate uridylyltransferase
MHPGLRAADEKMAAAGVPEPARAAFARNLGRLLDGDRGTMHGDELEPVHDVVALEELPDDCAPGVLDRAIVIKLNGGLGTSMGLSGPKSLIDAKPGVSFLAAIVRQVLALRRRHGVRLPLVLMDSFSTRAATLRALAVYEELGRQEVPLDFLQSREPKLRAGDLLPVEWPADPRLEWAPPGHGDLYPSLAGSGMLATLLAHGFEYAFVSNSDNLGAVLEPRILAWLDAERLPFAMEVVEGTEADRKGGHIARRGGRLVLRETAQAPDGDESFGDHRRWRHYNSNNLWIDLRALARLLGESGGALELPLIVNRKTVDPSDASSPEVIQLETAMGAAIGAIDGATAVRVPRSRFAPVKTTGDLLAVRSDAYVLREDDWHVEPAPERAGMEPPVISLDPRFYRLLGDFERRFPAGPPSLVRATRLVVRGDVTFGAGSVVVGDAEVGA